jgi:hypothetical protein
LERWGKTDIAKNTPTKEQWRILHKNYIYQKTGACGGVVVKALRF